VRHGAQAATTCKAGWRGAGDGRCAQAGRAGCEGVRTKCSLNYLTGHDYSSAPSYIPAGHLQICHQALVVVDTVLVVDEVLVVVDVVDDVEVLVWLVEVVVVVV